MKRLSFEGKNHFEQFEKANESRNEPIANSSSDSSSNIKKKDMQKIELPSKEFDGNTSTTKSSSHHSTI